MKKFVLLFLFFTNQLFGYKSQEICETNSFVVEVVDCIKLETESGKFDYFLVSNKYSYKVKSFNDFMTVKLAAHLKTKQGEKVEVHAHYHYYRAWGGSLRFTLMEITNAYQ